MKVRSHQKSANQILMQNARDENEGARVRRGGIDEEEGDDIGKLAILTSSRLSGLIYCWKNHSNYMA